MFGEDSGKVCKELCSFRKGVLVVISGDGVRLIRRSLSGRVLVG